MNKENNGGTGPERFYNMADAEAIQVGTTPCGGNPSARSPGDWVYGADIKNDDIDRRASHSEACAGADRSADPDRADSAGWNPDSGAKKRSAKKHGGKNHGGGSGRFFKALSVYVVPALLIIGLIAAGVWGHEQKTLAKTYRTTTEALYQRAFSELVNSMYELQIMLSKLMVSEAPSTIALTCDDIWRESGVCVGLMGQIPQSHVDTFELNQFLVRLGDYARSISKRVLRGTPVSDTDRKQLSELYAKSVEISNLLQERLNAGDIPIDSMTADTFFSSAVNTDDSGEEGHSQDSSGANEQSEFPTLIYDGPFSESTEKREPAGITGDEIDENAALQSAYKLIGEQGVTLESAGRSEGDIPAYDFSGSMQDGRRLDISITAKGGHMLWLMSSAVSDREGLPSEEESKKYVECGANWLHQQGYENMKPTYAQYYGGSALICYAASQDDVIIYNDLIKVWVDRETMGIIGADARNYLFSHVERDIPQPKISMEEAESMISPNLKVEKTMLALIPLTARTEALCYEFRGTFGEDEYVIYINAQTGDEEQIFRIINGEDGQLAI